MQFTSRDSDSKVMLSTKECALQKKSRLEFILNTKKIKILNAVGAPWC